VNGLLPFIIPGLVTGSVYALAGVGLVLSYKTSGIFNFAYGVVGSVAAYLFYWLHIKHQVPWPIAGLVSFLLLGMAVGFGFESLGRRIARAPIAFRVVATVGILTGVEAILTILFGPNDLTFSHFLPQSGFRVSNVNITWEEVIVTVISMLATGGLYALFRLSRLGMAMRAVVESPHLLALTGTSSRRVGRWAWVISSSFATLSGLLLAPDVSLNPTTLTLLVVQAFGAAAIGGFSNLPLTWMGGVAIGVIGSVLSKYGSNNTVIAGIPPSIPFIVLFLVLVVSRRTRFGVRELVTPPRPGTWRMPPRVQAIGGGLALVFFLFVPKIAGYQLDQWTILLSDALLFLSLGLLVRTAGQISLCQVSFAAIGVCAFSKLVLSAGIPWLPALLLAGLCAVPIGALLAIPAIRFSGLYLALATFGFGLLLEDMFYSSSSLFGTTGVAVPLPHLSFVHVNTQTGYYYVVLSITAIVSMGVVALTRTRLGRILQGISNSSTAMSASGNSVEVALVLVFCISAFIAGIAGALNGGALTQAVGSNYDPFLSLQFLVIVLIAAGGEPWYALMSALAFVVVPLYIHSSNVSYYLQIIFGVTAVWIAIAGQPQTRFLHSVQKAVNRLDEMLAVIFPRARTAHADPKPLRPAPTLQSRPAALASANSLEVHDVCVQFGGLRAVDGLSLVASSGMITGLIGPNGAGKSTALGACSGLIRAQRGSVSLGGKDITRLSPAARARRGLGRTFQRSELFDSLTVRENVGLGWEAHSAGASVPRQVLNSPTDRRLRDERVEEAFEFCKLQRVADQLAGSLPTGQRRLVEIARCLAGPYQMLLLDEPSSGLDPKETRDLGTLLRRVVQERGLGILLVEHDMSLVMDVCSQIYVLERGRRIFSGDPCSVKESQMVREAYLGGHVGAGSAR
jgi:ABC-type branched-subunit amino acid transport system ATPase component/branched-subunit amino acid ABC-type transport system permease component